MTTPPDVLPATGSPGPAGAAGAAGAAGSAGPAGPIAPDAAGSGGSAGASGAVGPTASGSPANAGGPASSTGTTGSTGSPVGAGGSNAGNPAAPNETDEALYPGNQANVHTTSLSGAGAVYGTQIINHFPYEPTAAAAQEKAQYSWQDDLHSLDPLQDASQPIDEAAVLRCAESLPRTRLLLLRHVPHRAAEADATLRALVRLLREKEPQRPALCNRTQRVLRPQELAATVDWRVERRNSLVYLYCTDDADSLAFFNRHAESVQGLCRLLQQMDCYLLLTLATPAGSRLRDEKALAQFTTLHSLDDPHHKVSSEIAATLNSRFDATLAACAALLPGLGVAEFVALSDALLPDLPPSSRVAPAAAVQPPTTPPPLTRHERWTRGEQDSVLAELRIGLVDANAPGTQTEAGMALTDEDWRIEMPEWLYRRYPVMLQQSLAVLTAHYLDPAASERYCKSFPQILRALADRSIAPLRTSWLKQAVEQGITGNAPQEATMRLADLFASLSAMAAPVVLLRAAVDSLATLIPAEEASLVATLRDNPLYTGPDRQLTPEHGHFWQAAKRHPAIAGALQAAVPRQAAAIDLLLLLVPRTNVDTGPTQTSGPEAIAQSSSSATTGLIQALLHSQEALEAWIGEPDDPDDPPASVARLLLRERLGYLLGAAPLRWLALIEQLSGDFATAERDAATADTVTAPPSWLRWDCIYALGMLGTDRPQQAPWPVALQDALVGCRAARERLGNLLAGLLCRDKSEAHAAGLAIDADAFLWLCRRLALALTTRELSDGTSADASLAELIAPLRARLPSAPTRELQQSLRHKLDVAVERRSLMADGRTPQFQTLSRYIKADQTLLRALATPRS